MVSLQLDGRFPVSVIVIALIIVGVLWLYQKRRARGRWNRVLAEATAQGLILVTYADPRKPNRRKA